MGLWFCRHKTAGHRIGRRRVCCGRGKHNCPAFQRGFSLHGLQQRTDLVTAIRRQSLTLPATLTFRAKQERKEIELLAAKIVRPILRILGGAYAARRRRRDRGCSGNAGIAVADVDPRSATMGVIGRSVVATAGSLPNGGTVRCGQFRPDRKLGY
jgi:hypothetical protein